MPKAIIDRTTLGANTGAQQTSNKRPKGMDQNDVNSDQKGKRADLRLLGWKASPSPSFSGLLAEGSLQLSSPISKGDPTLPAYEELDSALPSGSSPRGGASKGSSPSRQDHWRGLSSKKPRPDASRLEAREESPAPASSASSGWTGWRDWSDWGKWEISAICLSFPREWKALCSRRGAPRPRGCADWALCRV